ncbi:MAG TPA: cytochrome P460 family protein [Burkholderiales bacterium]
MNRRFLFRCAALACALAAGPAAAQTVAPAPNGITLPPDARDWRVIAVSHRSDNNTMRAIIGNDAAIAAARNGQTNPWPDGAILGKVVWSNEQHKNWPTATVPGNYRAQEFMIKDAKRFAKTGGWGYARWLGPDRKPYGKDASFEQECFGCHTPVKANDYVFTRPVSIP